MYNKQNFMVPRILLYTEFPLYIDCANKMVQWILVMTSSLEPEKFACFSKTLLYQGYKNNAIHRKSEIRESKLPCYIESLL